MSKRHQYKISAKKTRQKAGRKWRHIAKQALAFISTNRPSKQKVKSRVDLATPKVQYVGQILQPFLQEAGVVNMIADSQ